MDPTMFPRVSLKCFSTKFFPKTYLHQYFSTRIKVSNASFILLVEKNNTKNLPNLENIRLKEFEFNLRHTLQAKGGFEHNKHLKDKTLVNNTTSFLTHFWL